MSAEPVPRFPESPAGVWPRLRTAVQALVLLLTLCATSTAFGRGHDPLRLGHELPYEVLLDPEGTLDIEAVHARPDRFAAKPGPLNLGYTRSAVWLRFTVPASWNAGQDLWLEILPVYLDTVQLFHGHAQHPQRPWQVQTAGDVSGPRGEDGGSRGAVFRIPADQRGQVYLRVASRSTVLVVGALHTTEGYMDEIRSRSLVQGGQLGATIALASLFLLIGVWLRDRQTTVFGVAGCVITLQQSATQGVFSGLLEQIHAGAADTSVGVLTAWSLSAMIWIVRELVRHDQQHRTLARLLTAMALLVALAPASIPLDRYGPVITLAHVCALLAVGGAVLLMMRRAGPWWRGHGASALVLGAVLLGMGVIVAALLGLSSVRGWVLLLWGSLGQVVLVLLGVVLAARSFHRLKRLQVRIRRRLGLVRTVRRGLEQQVTERTRELQRSESLLRHALDAERSLRLDQRQFFAMISHEFRTPLAIIDMAAHTQQRYPTPDLLEQRARAGRIRRACARLRTLVDNCLVDERLASGGFRLDVRAVPVAELVRSAADLVGLTGQHTLEIDVGMAPRSWPCDPTLVRIAISNLVDNAVKYSRQGTIRVGASAQAGALRITVSDDGPGIAPQDHAVVFAAFERGGRADAGAGHGFGLYVTRRVARLHGGDATLDAAAPRGTVFHLVLPPAALPPNPVR